MKSILLSSGTAAVSLAALANAATIDVQITISDLIKVDDTGLYPA